MSTTLQSAVATLLSGAAEHCPTCGHARTTGFWLMVGFLGQAVFTARFLAQWIASEKRRDSVIPVIFWWLSVGGGMLLLVYAIHRRDPVITVGQSMGVFVYVRNLMLVAKRRRIADRESQLASLSQPEPSPIPRSHVSQARHPHSSPSPAE
jgi:lipid-A-disaccharide synthase-like uncharacterized protein